MPVTQDKIAAVQEKLARLNKQARLLSGIDPRGGHNRKTLQQHAQDGTFRKDRHGNLLGPLPVITKKPPPGRKIPKREMRKFCRNEADEKAVREGYWFSQAWADHVCNFFPRYLRHSKGHFAGKPFDLLPWQRELLSQLYGWVGPSGFRRFNRAFVECPKKQGKSTLAAGLGLYMLVADGEAGAEVYSVAADRDQASIVHGEAIRMADVSEELSALLKINRSTYNIHYKPTQSWYRALTASPATNQGQNAHAMIIDELHAWHGRENWDALRYATRNRDQPLTFVITTAGADLQSICRQQYDRAKALLSGAIVDHGAYSLIYEAQPTDDWTSESVWQACNPSYGVTINPRSFREDCESAKLSLSEEIAFKRYGLNIWASAENPWLKMDHWQRCAETYTEADLLGKNCHCGLDLARTRDMTAIALVFPDQPAPGEYRQLLYFVMPESEATLKGKVVDYADWAKRGWIFTTPGNVTDFDAIEAKVAELADKFRIEALYFDPLFAEELTQRIESRCGIQRVKFAQTILNYAAPTAAYERAVIDGRMHHNGNPVLTWQAGVAAVKEDANANKRVVKPKEGDYRKVDGIQAAIMALSGSLGPRYDGPGVVYIDDLPDDDDEEKKDQPEPEPKPEEEAVYA